MAAIIVLGGTFGAVFFSCPFKDVLGAFKGIQSIIKEPPLESYQIIAYANKARKEGILSLEKDIKNGNNPFLARALITAVDGIESHVIREALESELEYLNEYGKANSKFFKAAGGYAPTIGILGAVLGLIHVMENLSDPSKLGAGMAMALVATVYGVGSANLLFLPRSTKLEVRHQQEMINNEMILEGVSALSTGENPGLIEEKLTSFRSDLQENNRSSPSEKGTTPSQK